MRSFSIALMLAASLATVACGPRNQDKLEDNELASAEGGAKSAPVDDRCTRRATTDELKNQLFARAAQIRGSNGDNYAKIAGYALIEVDGSVPLAPVSNAELVDCKGHATVRLPAGLKVAGGRTTLGGDIGYSVAPGARGLVTLGQSDAIAIPLATLTQSRSASAPSPVPATTPTRDPLAPVSPVIPVPTMRPTPQEPPLARPVPVPANAPPMVRPSFDCRNARTSSERAVCANSSLAALDRDMAAQYRRALANAASEDRRLLVQTRDRFLMYRDRCGSDQCIAATYRGRMREINDIVAGRWLAPR
jgi:uncharacterized protein YecT (DUF1311 family)